MLGLDRVCTNSTQTPKCLTRVRNGTFLCRGERHSSPAPLNVGCGVCEDEVHASCCPAPWGHILSPVFPQLVTPNPRQAKGPILWSCALGTRAGRPMVLVYLPHSARQARKELFRFRRAWRGSASLSGQGGARTPQWWAGTHQPSSSISLAAATMYSADQRRSCRRVSSSQQHSRVGLCPPPKAGQRREASAACSASAPSPQD